MSTFASQVGRKVCVINLDFANDNVRDFYKSNNKKKNENEHEIFYLDILSSGITVESSMENYSLGPNGALIFCMEALLKNVGWLIDEIRQKAKDCNYFIFDLPGQIELYTHHTIVYDLLKILEKELNLRLCSVSLLDCYNCTQPTLFISGSLITLMIMLNLKLPHISVLSKVDLLKYYDSLPFQLDFFTEMLDITPLTRYLEGGFSKKESIKDFKGGNRTDEDNDEEDEEYLKLKAKSTSKMQQKFLKLSTNLCEIVNDFALVSLFPLDISNVEVIKNFLTFYFSCFRFNIFSIFIQILIFSFSYILDCCSCIICCRYCKWLYVSVLFLCFKFLSIIFINLFIYRMAMAYNDAIKEAYNERQKEKKILESSGEDNTNAEKTPKELFQYAAEHMESLYSLSLDIQEKYGKS